MKTVDLYYEIGKVVKDHAHCQDCAVKALMLSIANVISQMPEETAKRLLGATMEALPIVVGNMTEDIANGKARVMDEPAPKTKH